MAYEIDFVGSDKVTKDYDAIAFRYWSQERNRWIVCVFDGGTADAGEDLCNILSQYYLIDRCNTVDYVFCSHPDLDHASGLKNVLQQFPVRNLVMNRPWDYIDELFDKVQDGRITKESLERTLREKYKFIDELEKLAGEQRDCRILPAITEYSLESEMRIVSPSREFYIQCLVDSDKTPEMDAATKQNKSLASALNALRAAADWIKSIWGVDAIREGEETSAENESSVVLRVEPQSCNPFLLLGDVGCKGLTGAMDYADAIGKPLNQCDFVQIPHHGSRHNVSPSVLNRLIGGKVSQGTSPSKAAFVSVGKDSDHPRKCVSNAFINRGCAVYVSKAGTIHHSQGDVPDRGWSAATAELFSDKVESWDD